MKWSNFNLESWLVYPQSRHKNLSTSFYLTSTGMCRGEKVFSTLGLIFPNVFSFKAPP